MVKFENVKFAYPSRPNVNVLNGLNLTINQGETVALVGHSGCGKSTCIKLLERFYDRTSGKITIDDKDISGRVLKALKIKLTIFSYF